jgi:hypothetical protein
VCILASGIKERDREEENRCGRTDRFLKEVDKMTRLMERGA